MNKKGGFTLIELLAVIVILTIIAVIAVPIVLNIIDETKNNAGLRSAEMYVKAAELSIAQSTLKDINIPDDEYTIKDGDICLNDGCTETLKVEVNGEVPTSGKITIAGGNISSLELTYKDGKTIVKNSDGDLVYQDSSGSVKLCTANTSLAKALVWQGNADPTQATSYAEEGVGSLASEAGAYAKGVAYTCNFGETDDSKNLTFFVLSSTEDTVTLISGSNLGGTVAWCASGSDNSCDADGAKAALTERTANWSSANGGKLSEEQMLTIKLPTANQIAEVIGQTFSGSSISGLPKWLYSHAKAPIAYGYWTSTPKDRTSTPLPGMSDLAWNVIYDGRVSDSGVNSGSGYGVRPVITISKSNV